MLTSAPGETMAGDEPKTTTDAVPSFAARGPFRLRVVGGDHQGQSLTLTDTWSLVGSAKDAALVLTDSKVSRRHVEVRAGAMAVLLKDCGSRNGTWFEGSKVTEMVLQPGAMVRVGGTWLQLLAAEAPAATALSTATTFGGLQGQSRVMRQAFAQLERVANTDAGLLLQGPTGCGKEVAARGVHALGKRAAGPFVVVDCGAVTPELLHGALFGHVKGAYTGALEARAGAFTLAHGGTLFIDEVTAIPLELQPTLLRFVDRGEFLPLGAGEAQRVDVRIIAATRENLPAVTAAGKFREDLFHRLNVISVTLPALADRREDLAFLVGALLARLGVKDPGPIDGDNLALLQSHAWPGNVRELENVLRRAVTMGGPVPFAKLKIVVDAPRWGKDRDPTASFASQKEQVVEQFERDFLVELLSRTGGNIKLASRLSGIERSQLKRLLARRGLR